MNQELKECPFCGEKPEMYQKGTNTVVIKCKCGITKTQKVLRLSVDWLRASMTVDWNTRVPPNKVFTGKLKY